MKLSLKKLILSAIIATTFLAAGCSEDSSDTTLTGGFILNPSTLTENNKTNLPAMSYNVDLGGTGYSGNYAIIYTAEFSSANYVGIAVSNDPSDETFNMKIYFQSDSIPDSITLDSDSSQIKINGDEFNSGSITLEFTENSDNTYSVISTSSNAVIGTSTINSLNITAYYVGPND